MQLYVDSLTIDSNGKIGTKNTQYLSVASESCVFDIIVMQCYLDVGMEVVLDSAFSLVAVSF